MENIKMIDSNFYREPGSFVLKLLNDGEFDRKLYNMLVKGIYDLHNGELSREERLTISCKIWSIAFDVLAALSFNYDPIDVYTIDGLSVEKLHALPKALRMITTFFCYEKPIDLADVLL